MNYENIMYERGFRETIRDAKKKPMISYVKSVDHLALPGKPGVSIYCDVYTETGDFQFLYIYGLLQVRTGQCGSVELFHHFQKFFDMMCEAARLLNSEG